VVEWQAAYAYAVSAGAGGSVEGTTGGWLDAGTVVSNRAVAAAGCVFAGWENAPEGLEMENPLVFALEGAWTNVAARFRVEPGSVAAGAMAPGAGPGVAVAGIPPGFAAKVQRASRLDDPDWQVVGEVAPGETEWTDGEVPAGWGALYYRLADWGFNVQHSTFNIQRSTFKWAAEQPRAFLTGLTGFTGLGSIRAIRVIRSWKGCFWLFFSVFRVFRG
jgi:hypothetical protein